MDLANIFSVTTLLVLLSISGVKSATVKLSTSSDKGQLGNYSISLFCNYTLSLGERFLVMNLFRKSAMEATLIKIISFYEDNVDNATYYNEASDLKGRTVLANPLASKRSAILQFDSIQCADEADYRCELQFTRSGIQYVTRSDFKLAVTDTPRISPNVSNPYNPAYSEGLARLNLTCNADSNPPSNNVWTLPDGTVQSGFDLRITSLNTNHTGRYSCMAYTVWGGQNYTENNIINITVVATTTPPPTTTTTTTTTITTTTRSSSTLSVSKKPGTPAASGDNTAQAGVKSATVTLSTSSEKGHLGNHSISLFCNYTLSLGERFLVMNLFRKSAMEATLIKIISFYEDNVDNATYYNEASDLKGRTVLANPLASKRSAILQFDSIQCADEADYRCELQFTRSGIQYKTISDLKLVVTATPKFENQSLPYTPSTNLAETQNVIFTCVGNVGREPPGNFFWYKYVGGQSPGLVITNGINPISLKSVSGSCTYVRTEKLTLNLSKEDNQMVIRCTVQQTTTTEVGDGYIQTDPISVNYAPRISLIVSNPYNPTYSDGLARLNLTCNADSNPPSNYVWTLPDGTVQTGYNLRITSLTTNYTGRYTCMAYAAWGGQNYTANNSINITVVATTTPPPTTTTTTTRSSSTASVTKKPGTAISSGDNISQADAPRISAIVSDPYNPTYSEGLARLNLTCNSDIKHASNYAWNLPDGTVITGFQLRINSQTTNYTGMFTCMAYTEWGGQNYTEKNSINITVDSTTGMIIGIVIGGVVVIIAISIVIVCIKKRKKQEIEDLRHQVQNPFNTYEGLQMAVATSEPYATLNIEPSEDYQQSAYLNPYEGLQRTLESSEPYDMLEGCR